MNTSSTLQTAASTSLQIIVSQFKPCPKNTLVGFVTLELPAIGLSLHECTFHRDANGNAWVGLPARSYVQNGAKKWMRLVDTISKEWHYRFQHAAVRAVQDYLTKQQAPLATIPPKANIPKW